MTRPLMKSEPLMKPGPLMNIRPPLAIVLLALLAMQSAMAAVNGRVRASVDEADDIWVGQQVDVNLEILTTGYRFSDIQFNLPSVEGAFLLQTDSTTIKMSEIANGETWQVIRYPLALYPQKAGIIYIPPIKVRFNTAATFGDETRDFVLQTQTLTLQTRLPPGVSPGAGVVSTSGFELSYEWTPAPGSEGVTSANTGDAITLVITRRAEGISGMLLDPLPVFTTDGLRAYPEAPVVNDRVDRGSLTGERVDAVTWMLEETGNYQWPEIRFQWWDPVAGELKEKIVPGLTLDVNAPPVAGTANSATRKSATPLSWQRLLIIVVSILLAGVAGWRLRKPLINWLHNRRSGPEHQQKVAFRQLQAACRSGQASTAYNALSHWAHLIAPGHVTLNAFAAATGDQQFVDQMTQLQTAMVMPNKSGEWNGGRLLASLPGVRSQFLKQNKSRHTNFLPAMNPRH